MTVMRPLTLSQVHDAGSICCSLCQVHVDAVDESFVTSLASTSAEGSSFAVATSQEEGGHRIRAVLTSLELDVEDLP